MSKLNMLLMCNPCGVWSVQLLVFRKGDVVSKGVLAACPAESLASIVGRR